MPEPLTLPAKTRATLKQLYADQAAATARYELAASIALDVLGLEVGLAHQVDFTTGIVTPAATPTPNEPT